MDDASGRDDAGVVVPDRRQWLPEQLLVPLLKVVERSNFGSGAGVS